MKYMYIDNFENFINFLDTICRNVKRPSTKKKAIFNGLLNVFSCLNFSISNKTTK
jgi:hypothetical protein